MVTNWQGAKIITIPGPSGSDDTNAIRSANETLYAAGGGILAFNPGIWSTGPQVAYPSVQWMCPAPMAATLVLRNGSNADLIQSLNFNALTGTTNGGGLFMWSMSNLILDGNKIGQTQGAHSYPLRIYGYGNTLNHVRIRNGLSGGIYSEWDGGWVTPNPDSMESNVSDLKIHDCGGDGVYWNGPHDSVIDDVFMYSNTGRGMYLAANSGGTQVMRSHAYGNSGREAFRVEGWGCQLTNIQAEGAGVQVGIYGHNIRFDGLVYQAGAVYPAQSAMGIELGQTGAMNAAGCIITAMINGCNAGSIVPTNETGLNVATGAIWQTGGYFYGSSQAHFNNSDFIQFSKGGGAT